MYSNKYLRMLVEDGDVEKYVTPCLWRMLAAAIT